MLYTLVWPIVFITWLRAATSCLCCGVSRSIDEVEDQPDAMKLRWRYSCSIWKFIPNKSIILSLHSEEPYYEKTEVEKRMDRNGALSKRWLPTVVINLFTIGLVPYMEGNDDTADLKARVLLNRMIARISSWVNFFINLVPLTLFLYQVQTG